MKSLKTLFLVPVLVPMMLVPADLVYAGYRSSVEVTIELDSNGNAVAAMGSLGDAYNSADANQLIGCGENVAFAYCQAQSADAVNYVLCTTQNPDLIGRIRAVGSDGFVRFTVDPTTGECTTIKVSHNSFYRPKAP